MYQAELGFYGVWESHREYFATQAHTVVLETIAQATKNIKISSASSITSTSDPIRVFGDFATIELISNGHAKIIAGRASRVGMFELFGYDVRYYEELYEKKLDLLLQINDQETVNWSGRFRAPLRDAQVIPRPQTSLLPIWRAMGGIRKVPSKQGMRICR